MKIITHSNLLKITKSRNGTDIHSKRYEFLLLCICVCTYICVYVLLLDGHTSKHINVIILEEFTNFCQVNCNFQYLIFNFAMKHTNIVLQGKFVDLSKLHLNVIVTYASGGDFLRIYLDCFCEETKHYVDSYKINVR